MKRIVWLSCALLLLSAAGQGPRPAAAAPADDAKPTPREVFEKRLLPIFKSPNPSSCVQCHLAGVGLANYILPSHEDTFVSLRDQGLIDLDRPEKSKILALIKMGDGADGRGAARVHQKARDAEFAAFADWVARSAADPKLRALPKLPAERLAKPNRPDEVIRHARKDRVLESFTRNVWSLRFRCMNCHTEGTAASDKHVKEHGPRVAWFKAAGPEATLDYLRASRLIDTDAPEKSLLLRKPLNEVKHGGGVKFVKGDQGYRAVRTFLEDYVRLSQDGYPDARSLPPREEGPLQFGSDIWLKLADTPPAWGDKLLQVNVHAWDERTKGWEADPIATSDRVVWGEGRQWQHTLTLLAAKGSERATAWGRGKPALPRGRYLVKVYVDGEGRLAKEWKAKLGDADAVGQAETTSGWPEGYGQMTMIGSAGVRK